MNWIPGKVINIPDIETGFISQQIGSDYLHIKKMWGKSIRRNSEEISDTLIAFNFPQGMVFF